MNPPPPDDALYRWTDGRVVLLGERTPAGWVLARGWVAEDRLDHVRRWTFAAPRPMIGQVRRLVRDATDNTIQADAAAESAAQWIREIER